MRIAAQDIGRFKSPEQAWTYGEALKTRERFAAAVHDMVALDNGPLDKHVERGTVVLVGVDLEKALREKCQRHDLGEVDGSLRYDRDSLQVQEMELKGSSRLVAGQTGHGFLGLGQERLHITEGDSQTWFMADGSVKRRGPERRPPTSPSSGSYTFYDC